jgi:hypothetical protein
MPPIGQTGQRNQRSAEHLKKFPSSGQPPCDTGSIIRWHCVLQASEHVADSQQCLANGSMGQGIQREIQLQDIDPPFSQQSKLASFCVLG